MPLQPGVHLHDFWSEGRVWRFGPSARESQTFCLLGWLFKEGNTWLETVVSSEAWWTFTFAVVFVTFGKLLTFKGWEETIETGGESADLFFWN
jgi:hypothetical protein